MCWSCHDASFITKMVTGNNPLAAVGQGDLVQGHASLRDPWVRGAGMKAAESGASRRSRQMPSSFSPSDGGVLARSGRRHIGYPIPLELTYRPAGLIPLRPSQLRPGPGLAI